MRSASRPRLELPRTYKIRVRDKSTDHMPRMRGEEKIPECEGAIFEKRKLRALLARSKRIEATIWLGKEGVSAALLSQIENQLKARELVKVKTQRSALQEVRTSDLAEKVAGFTSSTLVEIIGHTFTLYRRRESRSTQRNSSRKQTSQ